jgi:hypothetical protein
MADLLSSHDQTLLFALLGLLFLLPALPNFVIQWTDHFVVRLALLSALALSALGGPYILLITFLIVMTLFMLRNQAKVRMLSGVRPINDIPVGVERFQNILPPIAALQPAESPKPAQEAVFQERDEELEDMTTPGEDVVVQPPAEKPYTDDEYTWTPGPEVGTNTFTQVAPSINEKIVLETEASDGQGGKLFDPLKRYVDSTQEELMQ